MQNKKINTGRNLKPISNSAKKFSKNNDIAIALKSNNKGLIKEEKTGSRNLEAEPIEQKPA